MSSDALCSLCVNLCLPWLEIAYNHIEEKSIFLFSYFNKESVKNFPTETQESVLQKHWNKSTCLGNHSIWRIIIRFTFLKWKFINLTNSNLTMTLCLLWWGILFQSPKVIIWWCMKSWLPLPSHASCKAFIRSSSTQIRFPVGIKGQKAASFLEDQKT